MKDGLKLMGGWSSEFGHGDSDKPSSRLDFWFEDYEGNQVGYVQHVKIDVGIDDIVAAPEIEIIPSYMEIDLGKGPFKEVDEFGVHMPFGRNGMLRRVADSNIFELIPNEWPKKQDGICEFTKEDMVRFGNFLLSDYRASVTSEFNQHNVTDADFTNYVNWSK